MGIGEIFSAWRSVAHIAEWSGLSLGALVGLGVAGYVGIQVPLVRRLVIVGAVAVVCLYAGLIHGGSVERRDVMAEWNDAKLKAERAAKARDAEIEMTVRTTYLPEIAALQHQADDRQHQVEDYERKMLAMASGSSCRLGPDAFRLRQPPKR